MTSAPHRHNVLSGQELARLRLQDYDRRTYPLGQVLRARSFRETEGMPMPLRRAHALNAALAGCETPITPGELLLGSGMGRFTADGDPAIAADAQSVLASIGGRSFVTHADHAAPDYRTLISEGLPGLRSRLAEALCQHADDSERADVLRSMEAAVDGLTTYLHRWADAAEAEAATTDRELRLQQAAIFRNLAHQPPQTFWEGLQLALTVHNAFQIDERYAMAIGRIDQYLWPLLARDLEAGHLDLRRAADLMEHFIAALAHRSDIQNVCVGGLTPDGSDGVNPLSYLCVEAVKSVGSAGGNLTARIGRTTPPDFLRACADCMRGGSGFPAIYNDDIQVPALIGQGYAPADARDYCFVGCIEAFLSGKQAPWADSRFNLLRCVEQTVAADPIPATWKEFWEAFGDRVRHEVDSHAKAILQMESEADARGAELTSPLLSVLTSDCIARGLDVNLGGALYPANHGIAGMGIGSVADSLAAVREFVYRRRAYSIPQLRTMLQNDFVGFDADRRRLLEEAPKYGNDDEEVDSLAVEAAGLFSREVLKYRTSGGGHFWGLMAANVQNVAAGQEVGATPDGRRAGEPVSDAASPAFGRDRNGPTAVVRSVSRVDYSLAPGGNVVNIKLHPSAVDGETGLNALTALLRTCFELGGIQLQVNTLGREVLEEAMAHPELYDHLVVRVSGFSAYFTRLSRAVQEDILARTEHCLR